MTDVYARLREHLDELPAGFPSTETGVEFRILKRLFTPEEAELACHVGMRLETAEAIAARAGIAADEAAPRLGAMSRKGLLFNIEAPDHPNRYMAAQFVIGIWEYHVNDLDPGLIRDLEEYLPALAREAFDPLPQLRTVPVGRSLDAGLEVLPYERAEELVREQSKFLVAPCICRKEHKLRNAGCDKLMEACLIFGWAADYYARNGLGRFITLEETLAILRQAEEQGLVLQPGNSREIINICCCCGDCCQVLLHLKRHPKPALAAASPFTAALRKEECTGCEACIERCQMAALRMGDGTAELDPDRCIGCGLCVSTCPSDAMRLMKKSEDQQYVPPETGMETYIRIAQERGKI